MIRRKYSFILTENFGSLYLNLGLSFDLLAAFIFDGIKAVMNMSNVKTITDNQGKTAYKIDITMIKEMMLLKDKPRTSFLRSLDSLFKVGILEKPDISGLNNEGRIIYVCKGAEYDTVTDMKEQAEYYEENTACTEENEPCTGVTKIGTPHAQDQNSPCTGVTKHEGSVQKGGVCQPDGSPHTPLYRINKLRTITSNIPPSPREAGGEENAFSSFREGYDPSDLREAKEEKKKKGSAERKRKPSASGSLTDGTDAASAPRSPEEESARRTQVSSVIDRAIETDANFSTYWLQKINAYFPEQNTEFCNFIAEEKRRYLREFVSREMRSLPGFRPEMAGPFVRHYAEHNDRSKLTRFENYAMKGGFSLRDRMEAWAENNRDRLPQAKAGGGGLDRTMQVYADAKNWAENL